MRGWTPQAFALAAPDFMQAIYHALIAERFAPEYLREVAVQHTDTRTWSREQKLGFIDQQLAANKNVAVYRKALYPEDEPVG